jgi:hypothetical protein
MKKVSGNNVTSVDANTFTVWGKTKKRVKENNTGQIKKGNRVCTL